MVPQCESAAPDTTAALAVLAKRTDWAPVLIARFEGWLAAESLEPADEERLRGTLLAFADQAAIRESEATIGSVIERVDTSVEELHAKAQDLAARSDVVKQQVERLMVAFQFHDRVHQILDQIMNTMHNASERLKTGTPPDKAEWEALLKAGYTTLEQHQSHEGQETAEVKTSEATFF